MVSSNLVNFFDQGNVGSGVAIQTIRIFSAFRYHKELSFDHEVLWLLTDFCIFNPLKLYEYNTVYGLPKTTLSH